MHWVTLRRKRRGPRLDAATSRNRIEKAAIAAFLKKAGTGLTTKTVWQRGIAMLDGSNSLYEWVSDSSTRPGVLPYSMMPQLERRDFVFNANDSYWLANPQQLLTGFSPLQGGEETPRSLRTRMNAMSLKIRPRMDRREGRKFSLEELSRPF